MWALSSLLKPLRYKGVQQSSCPRLDGKFVVMVVMVRAASRPHPPRFSRFLVATLYRPTDPAQAWWAAQGQCASSTLLPSELSPLITRSSRPSLNDDPSLCATLYTVGGVD